MEFRVSEFRVPRKPSFITPSRLNFTRRLGRFAKRLGFCLKVLVPLRWKFTGRFLKLIPAFLFEIENLAGTSVFGSFPSAETLVSDAVMVIWLTDVLE